MIPNTIIGLCILAVAVLPGLVYTLTFERQAGSWGVTLADRVLRLIAVSFAFHLIAAWPEYWLFRATLADHSPSDVVLTGEFALLWFAAAVLVVVPATIGTVVGGLYRTRNSRSGWDRVRAALARLDRRSVGESSSTSERRLLNVVLGPDPAPRAWDNLFAERPTAYMRVRLIDETVLAGLFATSSYAAGFPNDPDLLLEEAYSVGSEGELGERLGYAVYVPGEQIAWLEIIPADVEEPE